MLMNGKEGVGRGDEWNSLMGGPLPTLLSERRLGPGQAWKGEGRGPGLLEGGCKHMCPGIDL